MRHNRFSALFFVGHFKVNFTTFFNKIYIGIRQKTILFSNFLRDGDLSFLGDTHFSFLMILQVIVILLRIKNQEILFGSINYWEGPIVAEGFLGNKKVTGVGFMELVGYPSHYSNINYVKDEVRKTTDWFISAAKKNTFSLLGRIKRKITG